MAMAIQIAFTNQAEQEAPSGTDRKNQNNKSTVDAFVFHRRIFADMGTRQRYSVALRIFPMHMVVAHGIPRNLPEGIDLHGTGERKHNVCDHIEGEFIRQKSGDPNPGFL